MSGSRLYAAYGSNLHLPQMAVRCPTAEVVGDSEIAGLELLPSLGQVPTSGGRTRMKSMILGVVSAPAYIPIPAKTYSVPHRLPHERCA